jgi:hypothetical protein
MGSEVVFTRCCHKPLPIDGGYSLDGRSARYCPRHRQLASIVARAQPLNKNDRRKVKGKGRMAGANQLRWLFFGL